MGNVLRMEKRQQIQVLAGLGWSSREISRQTGIDRDTVSKYRGGFENPPKVPADPSACVDQNPPEVPTDPPGVEIALPGTNSVQLRPHVDTVRSELLQGLTAQRIYQDLVEGHGYTGSYDSVKRYVRKLRKRARPYQERLQHPPGREAQVDFGKATCRVMFDGRPRRPWLFKMTLSCSKHAYEELVERQDMETFLRCHERAFAFFGGVPQVVTLDNIKSGVIKANIYDPVLNQTYLALATHYGFAANPCMPCTPQHKGVVERDIGYTKHNALDGRIFQSLDEGNSALRHWNKRWARTRIHGTTKCQVWKMFCEVERPCLSALPATALEYFTVLKRKVDVTGLIEAKANYYGVPHHLIGEYVVVHYNQAFVKIFDLHNTPLVTHRTLRARGKVCQPLSCQPPWKHPDLESQERYYCRKARQIGPALHTVVHQTLCTNDPLAIRRVRGFLSLSRRFAPAVVEQAAEKARDLQMLRVDSMRAFCEQVVSDQNAHPRMCLTQQHDLIRPLTEYETLFTERTALCQ